jgi:protein SCO1/2
MKTQTHPRVLACIGIVKIVAVALLVLSTILLPARAQSTLSKTPDLDASVKSGVGTSTLELMKQVRMENRLNALVPLDARFRDETGKDVRFGNYFGEKPVMLLMISYACRLLCDVEMQTLQTNLKKVEFTPGKQFNLVVIGIDPQEGPKIAAASKANFLKEYGKNGVSSGVHFLTGDKSSVRSVTDAVGYHYVYDPSTRQWIHPATTVLLTPEGHVARYFNKLNYSPRDLRLGLVETASEKIGTVFDSVMLTCFHYNTGTGRYSVAVMSMVRLMGIFTVLGTLLGIAIVMRRERVAGLASHKPKTRTV